VPIIQVALSGEGLTEQNLADIASTVGARHWSPCPAPDSRHPFGGKQRQVQIDLIPRHCRRADCRTGRRQCARGADLITPLSVRQEDLAAEFVSSGTIAVFRRPPNPAITHPA